MKKPRSRILICVLQVPVLFVLTLKAGRAVAAESNTPDTAKPAAVAKKDVAKENSADTDAVKMLQTKISEQQAQIEKLTRAVDLLTERLNETSAKAPEAPPRPAPAAVDAHSGSVGQVTSLTPVIPAKTTAKADLAKFPGNASLTPTARTMAQGGSEGAAMESPLHFQLGSAYFTPVGFMDFTTVWRSTALGSGIGTNFAAIPYGTGYANNLSEWTQSMQNSRVGLRIDAQAHGAHILAYLESDFLGNNPGNYDVSSNSNTLRSRVFWLDVSRGKWEVLGGQTWSLITPGRKGISGIPGDIFFTDNIDTNYQLGLVWGRIPEFRFVYHPTSKVALAFAADASQQYAGGSSGGPLVTFPSNAALNSALNNELNTGGNGSKVPNVAPDFIAKLAVDPSVRLHFEIGGVERNFKLYNPTSAQSFSAQGGGGFLNANFEVVKGLRIVTNNFWSDGGGRYIFGQVPDLIVKADGSPSLIHTGSSVTGLELTHKNTVLYGYYGGVYVWRNTAIDTNGKFIGYGYPGSGSSQNRAIQEGTFGFNQTIWKDAKWGAVNFMGQYSYVTRNPWSVATGSPSNADINMVFLNLRYSLPGTAPVLGK